MKHCTILLSWIKSDQFLACSNFSKHHLVIHTLKHLDLFLPKSHFFCGDHFGSLFVGQFLLEGDSSITYSLALICIFHQRPGPGLGMKERVSVRNGTGSHGVVSWGGREEDEKGRIDIQAFLIIPTLAKSFISKQHLAARIPIWITLGCWADSTLVSVDPVIAHAATFDQIAASL